VAACAKAENEPVAAPINAVSHIAFGDEAATHDEASAKYTGTGLALNASAVTAWALIHELLYSRVGSKGNVATALACGAAVSAAAYVTDYYIVPKRFTPGFEKRLSGWSLFGVYSALALSLAAGSICKRGSDNKFEPTFAT
jgi:hypothetical protein